MDTLSHPNGGSTVADHSLLEKIEQNIYERLQGTLHDIVHKGVTSAIAGVAQPTAAKPLTRPASGGRCAAVWDKLDELKVSGEVPTLKQIKKVARRRRWNENNTRIEYYRWRNFNGIRGQVQPQSNA